MNLSAVLKTRMLPGSQQLIVRLYSKNASAMRDRKR